MALASTGLCEKGWQISVIGFDPGAAQIKLAKEAKFTKGDLAFLNSAAARRWFQPRSGGWAIKPTLGPKVEFIKANHADLEGGPLAEMVGSLDVVFCRGLSFDCPDNMVGRLVRNMASLLADNGILMSAPGEIFPAPPDCRLEVRDGVVYLRRLSVKTKTNVFFAARPARSGGRAKTDPAPPESDARDKLLTERIEELLGSDPDEARETVLELLGRDTERGILNSDSLALMIRVEEALGRFRRAEASRDFLAAWVQGGSEA
jgi:SAM-dependent methyltransferase